MDMTINHLNVRVNKPLMEKVLKQLNSKVVSAEQYIWYNNWVKSGKWRSSN